MTTPTPTPDRSEVVRDSLLACAGVIDGTMGGQELENSEALTSRRRSLYFSCHPETGGKSEFGAIFDAPDANECYRRTRSVIPQQALALTNNPLIHELSGKLAAVLAALLVGCALSLVNAQYQARHLFIELERAQSKARQLDTNASARSGET